MAGYQQQLSRPDRTLAVLGVVLVHAMLLAILLIHQTRPSSTHVTGPIILIPIVDKVQPARKPERLPKPVPAETGEAGKRANPTTLVAPAPAIPSPNTTIAAPVAGTGVESTSGAADSGSGPGAGGSGVGAGGGGGGTQAQWLSGGLRNNDYPREALRSGAAGVVSVRFTVLVDGSIANCRIARSSGNAQLDAATCALLTQRLRFRPATDASGRPVESELGSDYTWGIRRRP